MKKEDILFNIITRTHNRPDLFKRCVDSIKNHRFKNIHHIVTYQNDKDLEYINKYKIKNTTVVPVPNIKKFKGVWLDRDGHYLEHAPYNTFFNIAHKFLQKGWILYLDDDDILADHKALDIVADHIVKFKDENRSIITPMNYLDKYSMPSYEYLNYYASGKALERGQIAMSSFIFHSKNASKMIFDEWAFGDYYTFSNYEKHIFNRYVLTFPVVRQPKRGMGYNSDSYDRINKGDLIFKKKPINQVIKLPKLETIILPKLVLPKFNLSNLNSDEKV